MTGAHDIVVPPRPPSPVPASFVNFIPYAPKEVWTPEPSIIGRACRRRGIVRRFGGGRIFWGFPGEISWGDHPGRGVSQGIMATNFKGSLRGTPLELLLLLLLVLLVLLLRFV